MPISGAWGWKHPVSVCNNEAWCHVFGAYDIRYLLPEQGCVLKTLTLRPVSDGLPPGARALGHQAGVVC